MNDTDIFGAPADSKSLIRDTDVFSTFVMPKQDPVNVLPTMRDSLKQEMAGRPGASALAGFGTFLDNAALRLKQLTAGLTPQDEAKFQANRDLVSASPWAFAGNVGANAATLGPIAGPGVLSNAAVGAGAGFMGEPVAQGENGAGRAVMGGLFGAGGGILGKLMTGSPIVPVSPQARELLDRGVVPTVGQAAAGPVGRVVGRTEEKLQSVPLVGDMITAARERARGDFNRAAINMGLPPGAKPVSQIGDEGVALAKQALGSAYDDIYKNASVSIDPQLLQGVAAAKNSTVVPLGAAGERKFDEILKRNLWDRLPKGQSLPAADAKMTIEADLGKAARDLRSSSVSAERDVGQAVENARKAFRDLMARNLPAADAAALPAVDKAYATMVPVKQAAERAKAQGGVFTPYQLQSAARPGTEMRDFANAAQGVLGSRVANSGTTDRALVAGMLAPGAAAYYFGMPMLGALSAAPAAYSRPGARWLLGDVTNPAIQGLSPYIAQGLRQFGELENKGSGR